jgi:hypothetical protein
LHMTAQRRMLPPTPPLPPRAAGGPCGVPATGEGTPAPSAAAVPLPAASGSFPLLAGGRLAPARLLPGRAPVLGGVPGSCLLAVSSPAAGCATPIATPTLL